MIVTVHAFLGFGNRLVDIQQYTRQSCPGCALRQMFSFFGTTNFGCLKFTADEALELSVIEFHELLAFFFAGRTTEATLENALHNELRISGLIDGPPPE